MERMLTLDMMVLGENVRQGLARQRMVTSKGHRSEGCRSLWTWEMPGEAERCNCTCWQGMQRIFHLQLEVWRWCRSKGSTWWGAA